jgi:adenylate cyclase
MTETRKLAAIMCVDVVGYSRLMGDDEAGTARAVREHREAARPIVASRGGRIVKTMGDGLLLEFPSVVDAVECAVTIQTLMIERNAETPESKRIVYRVGVHLGDVLIEGDDILGEGVNIAARLEGICEPGGVLISGSAHEQVRGRIEAGFVDLGERDLKNIARPVRTYRVAKKNNTPTSQPTASVNPTSRLSLPDKPSLAVLAFQNMSGDPEQEYFADGVVEEIITGLSRIKWLFVIARNSSFVYKGHAVDIRQVGHNLGVRYVLEGSVRKAGNRLRITAQLIEAETGAHLWADRFDGGVEDIFDLQDQVTERVVGVIEPTLRQSEIERSRRKRPENLEAYDLYLRALPYQRLSTREEIAFAEPLLRQAITLDPNYAPAHLGVAWCHLRRFQFKFEQSEKDAALLHARSAISFGADNADVLARAAPLIIWLEKDVKGAIGLIERALSLNPASPYACFFGALAYSYNGESTEAVFLAERAMRLSPFDRLAFVASEARGIAALAGSEFADAAYWFGREVQENPGFVFPKFAYAAALALSGRVEEARPALQEALELAPEVRVRIVSEMGMVSTISEKFAQGARLLGWK